MIFKRTMKDRITTYRARLQAGNAIVMLFAAVGVAGLIGYGLNTVMRGPAVTTAELSRHTIAENNLVATSRLAIAMSARGASRGDCDGDGFVEPLEYRLPTPAPAYPAIPENGGFLPMTIGASMTDPWGTQYGYCVWNPGTVSDPDSVAGCRTGAIEHRLKGAPRDDQPAIAIISAGANGEFETKCNAYEDADNNAVPDTVMLEKPDGSDDIVLGYTYAEANGVGAGEWKIDPLDPTTATIGKGLKVGGGATFDGSLTASAGLILPLDAGDGNDTTTGACDAAHDTQLRLNMASATATTAPTLEMCNFSAGGGWVPVSGGGAAVAPTYPTCLFTDFKKVGGITTTNVSRNAMHNSTFFTITSSGGSSCIVDSFDASGVTTFTPLSYVDCSSKVNQDSTSVIQGNYIYFASSDDSLVVYDISNPASMAFKTKLTDAVNLAGAKSIAILDDTHIVVSAPTTKRITVVDITDPASPAIVGSVTDATWLDNVTSIAVKGKYVYTATFGAKAVTVVNLTTPTAPAVVGHVTGTQLDGANIIAIYDHYVIASNIYSNKLATVDIAAPTAPVISGVKDFSSQFSPPILYMHTYGKYLFAAGDTSSSYLAIYDLSDPVNPLYMRGTADTDVIPSHPGDFIVNGKYLYLGGYGGTNTYNQTVYNLGCDPVTGTLDNSTLEEITPPNIADRLDSAMIGHWALDDYDPATAVTTVKDSIAGNDGTFVNTPIWNPDGPTGNSSLTFNMDDRDAIKIPGLLGSPTVGSVSMWVNIQREDTGPGAFFFSIGDDIILKHSKDQGIEFSYWNGSIYKSGQTNENIQNTGWHYVTATWDDVNDVYRTYVDGTLKNEFNNTDAIQYNHSGGADTYIGRLINATTFDFDGGIDDVRVYGVALGPSEVAELYRRMKASSSVVHSPRTTAANAYMRSRISGGFDAACAIKSDNSLWCWGQDDYGQLGNGTLVTANQSSPYKVDNNSYTSVSVGYRFACAIRTDGTLWCWGDNTYGGIANGTTSATVHVYSPTQVSGGGTWVQISTGDNGACGIKSDSTLWCWGGGTTYLGNGTSNPSTVPVQIAGNWSSVTTANTVSCGVKTDGSGWCWGYDAGQALGNGAVNATQLSPVPIESTGPWANISAAFIGSCGVKMDGSGWCWGQGDATFGYKGLGANVTGVVDTPARIPGINNFTYIASSRWGHTCGLTTDGSLYCWGADNAGQLGNGLPNLNMFTPTRVSGAGGWTAVTTTGNGFTCGMKADDSIWCWGADSYLTLGNGPTLWANQSSPTPVNLVDPPIFSWNDAATIIMGKPGYSLASGIGYLSETGTAQGFAFTNGGKAKLVQPSTANQLTIQTSFASSSVQTTLRVAPDTTATDVTTNLVAKWTLDESSGTTAASTPTTYPGTLTGGSWMPSLGRVGGSLYFDGVDDSVVIANDTALNSAAITVAAWVKLDGTQPNNTSKVVSKCWNNHSAPTYNSYSLSMSGFQPIAFETGHTGTADVLLATVPSRDGWFHVVGTYNPAATAPQKKIYINGVLNNSKTLTTPILYDTNATSGKLYIGVAGYLAEYFKGQIDDVRIYNTDLTAAQVAQLYAYETSVAPTPRTIGVDGSASNNFAIARNNAAATNWLSGIATPDLAISSAGLVGIGTASPVAKMDVNGGVRIGTDAECYATAQSGKIRYTKGGNPPWQYCDGSAWKSFSSVGTSSKKWKRSRSTPEMFGGFEGVNCGIKTDGTMWCWGYDAYNLGTGATGHAIVSTPVQVGTDTATPGWSDWVYSATSYVDTNYTAYGQGFSGYGIRSNGTLWSWGGNDAGQLGIGTKVAHNRPVQVKDSVGTGYYTDWKQVSGSDLAACGLRANGQIYCWGDCWNGSCGDNNATNREVTLPVLVTDTAGSGSWSDWVQVTVGHDTACGIRASGVAYCWGNGDAGALGNNTGTSSATPKIVLDDSGGSTYFSDWKYLSMGNWVGCGLRANGQIYCWGANSAGTLGDGTTGGNRLYPHLVVNSSGGTGWSDWATISLRTDAACGVRTNGTAWCWGSNSNNQIGNQAAPSGGMVGKPYQVLGSSPTNTCTAAYSDWTTISTGWGQVCGIRASGDAYCWGANDWGAFGNGSSGTILGCPQAVLNP